MGTRNSELDEFFDGPSPWRPIFRALREILLSFPLEEERKWGQPCYRIEGKNAFIIGGFKDFCVLSFFKGALLKDPAGILVQQGRNTRSARVVQLTGPEQVVELEATLRNYIAEAIEVEKAGLSVENAEEPGIPDELAAAFVEHPGLEAAFGALTPGRRRGWCLFFSAPKRSATRSARIMRSVEAILAGKGMHDR